MGYEKQSLVSIIMPTHNSSQYVVDAINSVLCQTYKNWELLITDDASSDDTVSLIKEKFGQDQRIKVFSLATNSGAAIARNNSIEKAQGDFIAFLDSDDMWEPNKLELQVSFMVNEKCFFSYANYKVLYENGETKEYRPPVKISYKKLLNSNYIGTLTAMYDCRKLGKIFMPNIRKRQDYALWLKILREKQIEARSVEKFLGVYRISSNSISSKKTKLIKYQYQVFHDCENMSVIRSWYHVIRTIINKIFFKY